MKINFTEIAPTLYADNENKIELFLPNVNTSKYVLYIAKQSAEFTRMDRAIKYLTDMKHTVTFLPTNEI